MYYEIIVPIDENEHNALNLPKSFDSILSHIVKYDKILFLYDSIMALPITYIPLTKIRDEIPHICICRDLHGVIKAQSFLETHLRQDTILFENRQYTNHCRIPDKSVHMDLTCKNSHHTHIQQSTRDKPLMTRMNLFIKTATSFTLHHPIQQLYPRHPPVSVEIRVPPWRIFHCVRLLHQAAPQRSSLYRICSWVRRCNGLAPPARAPQTM